MKAEILALLADDSDINAALAEPLPAEVQALIDAPLPLEALDVINAPIPEVMSDDECAAILAELDNDPAVRDALENSDALCAAILADME